MKRKDAPELFVATSGEFSEWVFPDGSVDATEIRKAFSGVVAVKPARQDGNKFGVRIQFKRSEDNGRGIRAATRMGNGAGTGA